MILAQLQSKSDFVVNSVKKVAQDWVLVIVKLIFSEPDAPDE